MLIKGNKKEKKSMKWEIKETIDKISDSKSWFFEMMSKIDTGLR